MEKTSSTKIPPIAHFIWAGGKKLLPPEGIDNICLWIDSNKKVENFQAWLWIDIKTAPEGIIENYKEMFRKKGINVFTEQEAKAKDLKNESIPFLIVKDIGSGENKLRDDFVAYEIEKLRPNYGSSSDLLRYNILFKFGGFYCDCTDVKPGKDSLNIIFSEQYSSNHVMYVEHYPQQPFAEQKSLQEFATHQLGNDTFATNTNNSTALQMCLWSRKHYELPPNNLLPNHILTAHSGNNIKDTTIARTGPGLVRVVILQNLGAKLDAERGVLVSKDGKSEIRRFRDGNLALATPGENTANWLNTRITKYDENSEEAITQVIKTIEFEVKHFKVLRLDDHISDLVAATDNKLQPGEILKKLAETIQKNSKNILYTQLTGEFKETIEYTLSNKMLNIFNLNYDNAILAINTQCYLNDFIKVENIATSQKDGIIQQAKAHSLPIEKLGLSAEGIILYTQRPEVQQTLCQQITLGIKYIQYFSEHLENYSMQDAEKIKMYLIDRLQKYQKYAVALNLKVQEKYQVDIHLIDDLLTKLLPKETVENKEKIIVNTK